MKYRNTGTIRSAECSTRVAQTHPPIMRAQGFGGHAGGMNTRKCGGSAVPTDSCRVASAQGEGGASRAERVMVINLPAGLLDRREEIYFGRRSEE